MCCLDVQELQVGVVLFSNIFVYRTRSSNVFLTSSEVDSFITHCSALTAAATCQIWWKFANNF